MIEERPAENDGPTPGNAAAAPAAVPASGDVPRRPRGILAILRPPGLLVFAGVALLIGLLWYLFADLLVKRGVEATGAAIVGARVDLARADLRPLEGSLRLEGLQVTNPSAPMTNLFEADEIFLDLLLEPLLTRKVWVQSARVTGVRFNTPREESGALDDPPEGAGRLWREIEDWAEEIRPPPLSLEGLFSTVIETEAISPDSLRTLARARALATAADSLRDAWEARVAALDPRPRIDSLRAVVERLEGFRLTPLNAAQLPGLVRDGRAALERLTALESEISSLDDEVGAGMERLTVRGDELAALREQDLAYARGLLNIPSLEGPDLSGSIFGGVATAWTGPILYWVRTLERYLPPGLDPRNRPGPARARAEGTTVEFPGRASYPAFLLEEAELGVELGGTGAAAGAYVATLRNLTSQPTVLGRPLELVLGRASGAAGPEGIRLAATLDHTTEPVRDSVTLSLAGVELPAVGLGGLDGELALGTGDVGFDLRRVGEEIDARMRWASDDLRWLRGGAPVAADAGSAAPVGSAAWATDLVWRALAELDRLELEMGLSGSLGSPSLHVSSNVGSAVAESLRAVLGDEIRAAEARVREEVDRHVQPLVQDARGRIEDVRTEVAARVGEQRAEVEALRARLEERVEALVPGRAD